MNIKIPELKKLIDLVESSSLSELEITEDNYSIRISRLQQVVPVQSAPQAMPTPPAQPANGHLTSSENPKSPKKKEGHVVKSPMVGTAYLAPSPDAPPFVKVGQKVSVGDPLCIIEAMKMMNRIESDQAGTIISILAESGKPVEFEQPLFVIG